MLLTHRCPPKRLRLTRWLCLIVLIVIPCCSFRASAQRPPEVLRDLKLEIGQLRDQRLCGGEIYSELLDFNVRYVNVSAEGYDVLINGNGPVETMVAKTLQDLEARKFEADWSPYIVPPVHDSKERTVHLAPGNAAESTLSVGLYVSVGPVRVPETLTAGSYFFKVRVQVGVLKSSQRGKQTAANPRSVLIESNAIRVEVPRNPKLDPCAEQ